MIVKTYEVNAIAPAYCVQQFLPGMMARDKGHIVNISSVAGIIGVPGLADYCGSKFAMYGFNESIRTELNKRGSNVKTTCVCPQFIDTGMFEGAKNKFNLITPMLTKDWISRRVVYGILQDEDLILHPWFTGLAVGLRAFLPVPVLDQVIGFFGITNSMDHFTGRPPAIKAKL